MRRWLVLLILIIPVPLRAHHIMGIPHYAYDEQYPQIPILTYVAELGPNQLRMTGYPGIPRPGERCTLHVYVQDRASGVPYPDPIQVTVFRESLFGADEVVYGPLAAELEENVHKYYPEFPDEANYLVRIEFQAEGAPWIVDLPMVVGNPGSAWSVVGFSLAGVALFLVVIRAVRIKRARRFRMARSPV